MKLMCRGVNVCLVSVDGMCTGTKGYEFDTVNDGLASCPRAMLNITTHVYLSTALVFVHAPIFSTPHSDSGTLPNETRRHSFASASSFMTLNPCRGA